MEINFVEQINISLNTLLKSLILQHFKYIFLQSYCAFTCIVAPLNCIIVKDLSTSFIHWFLKHILLDGQRNGLYFWTEESEGLNSAYVNLHSPVPTLNVLQNCSDKEATHMKPSNQLLARADTEQAINSKKELIRQSSHIHKCKAAARLEP